MLRHKHSVILYLLWGRHRDRNAFHSSSALLEVFLCQQYSQDLRGFKHFWGTLRTNPSNKANSYQMLIKVFQPGMKSKSSLKMKMCFKKKFSGDRKSPLLLYHQLHSVKSNVLTVRRNIKR